MSFARGKPSVLSVLLLLLTEYVIGFVMLYYMYAFECTIYTVLGLFGDLIVDINSDSEGTLEGMPPSAVTF